jgi:DNA-binding transcriptional LysR family regulator
MIKMDVAAKQPHLLRVNCEYRSRVFMQCHDQGVDIPVVYRSEREDWIQSMVAAGFGVTFLPESSVVIPGVMTRPLTKPDVIREVSLVSIYGRCWSPAVQSFARAIETYPWQPTLQKQA